MRKRTGAFLRIGLVFLFLAGCGQQSPPVLEQPMPSVIALPEATATPRPSELPSPSPVGIATPGLPPGRVRSVDLAEYSSTVNGEWFSVNLESLPETPLQPGTVYTLTNAPIVNRNKGQIAPTLISRYLFLQFGDISLDLLEEHAHTMRALFVRSALMSFVDYSGDRVLDWNRRSSRIPLDVKQVIALANRLNIPVYLELNYSNFIPGPVGSGVESLQPADTISRTLDYLRELESSGLSVEGVTFGDEIEDQAGYGEKKPTLQTTDMAARFIEFAEALKAEFPQLKLLAFDSYISAARGKISLYDELFKRIRQAEIEEGKILLDGFVFRESYVFIDADGKLMDSQSILDDTESLYRSVRVYRYDPFGKSYPHPNQNYLNQLIAKMDQLFERRLEIGLTEYLPAGPVQIDESDTSPYPDIDFILHYADVIGIYGTLGLDYVSTFLFANSVEQAKCYLDRQGVRGANYPVFEQLGRYFAGEILQIDQQPERPGSRIKVYAARQDGRIFVMMLNKIVGSEQTIRVVLPGELDLTLNLPGRSYTSLVIEGGEVLVSGIGD